jgi:hypothetical protein
MQPKTALLLDIPDPYYKDLILALDAEGYRLLSNRSLDIISAPQSNEEHLVVPANIRKLQEWLDSHPVSIDCMISATSIAIQIPPDNPITYPPYHLYETILKGMYERGYGRIVNLYEGPGSATGMSMPQLKTIAARYEELLKDQNILFNSVNIGTKKNLSPEQQEEISRQRMETILWLATTEAHEPRLEFFRGYQD